MFDFKVVSLFNNTNQVYINIFQRTKREFEIKTQISFNNYNYEYVWGLYELSRSVFFHIINGYEMIYNDLGYDFEYAVHSGDFKKFEQLNEERTEEHTEERQEEQVIENIFLEQPIEEREEEHTEEREEEQIMENILLEPPILTRSCYIYD